MNPESLTKMLEEKDRRIAELKGKLDVAVRALRFYKNAKSFQRVADGNLAAKTLAEIGVGE